jgi:hypothetical protein
MIAGMLGSNAGGRPLDVEVTELVDKVSSTECGGGTEAMLQNATLMAPASSS